MLPKPSQEVEEILLSELMLDSSIANRVFDEIRPEMFSSDVLRDIFKAIRDVYREMNGTDVVAVAEKLNSRKFKYMDVFYDLMGKASSSANFVVHIDLLQKHYKRRFLKELGRKLATMSDDSDEQKIMDSVVRQISELQAIGSVEEVATMEDLSIINFERYLKIREGGETGLKTGFKDLDKMLMGIRDSIIIYLAARPSVGKTALALNIAKNMALNGHAVGFISLEMSSQQLFDRLLASYCQINLKSIRSGLRSKNDFEVVVDKIDGLRNLPIIIYDQPVHISKLRAIVSSMIEKYNIECLFIDYLQLFDVPRLSTREQEVAYISRTLKGVAKELSLPLIVLSQLSRSVEKRENKRPVLSDLRESGSLEQDADVVMFLYRNKRNEDGIDVIEVLIEKYRDGPTGAINLVFNRNVQTFFDYIDIEPENVF